MSFYESEARISKDPIVGLIQQAGKDNSPEKLVAIIGSAADDNGKLIVPEAVNETIQELAAKGFSMEYAPSPGIPMLAELLSEEILGKTTCDELKNSGINRSEIVTVAGTNAITIALLACTNSDDQIITHNPHWAGYDSITIAINRKPLTNFDILDANDNFNIAALEQTIKNLLATNAKSKIALVINTPYDNPLGKDFGKEAWKQIGNVLAKYSENEILIILDTAYVDFGPEGKDYSRLDFLPDLFKRVNNKNFNLIIAGTVSKSFAMYGARVGVATLLSANKENTDNWKDVAGGCVRGTFSNASRMSQEIALNILQDKAKLATVHDFQKTASKLINKRREAFIAAIKDGLTEEFRIIRPDSGFFVSMKIDNRKFGDSNFAQEFYKKLLASHLYAPLISDQFLRIPPCGLSEAKLEQVAKRIIEVNKSMLAAK